MEFFSAKTTFYTFFAGTDYKYPMSYIEFIGTIFTLCSVWLVTRRKIATWPVGILGAILFLCLFYQLRLYADTLEQIYFIVTGFVGWWLWSKNAPPQNTPLEVEYSPKNQIAFWIGVTLFFTLFLSWSLARFHIWMPKLFPQAATFIIPDALTTVMSFVTQWLMVKRRVECWIYWVIVDVIGIWLYFVKGTFFLSLLYVIFLVLASRGLYEWHRAQKNAAK